MSDRTFVLLDLDGNPKGVITVKESLLKKDLAAMSTMASQYRQTIAEAKHMVAGVPRMALECIKELNGDA